MKTGFSIALSEIDQARFGICVAKASGVTASHIQELLEFSAKNQVELLIARCGTGNFSAAHGLEKAGFLLMDTLCYYTCARPLANLVKPATLDISIAPARSEEAPQILQLASRIFENYPGHYHADARLDRQASAAIYSDWAFNLCQTQTEDKVVLAARLDNKIIGFGAVNLIEAQQSDGVLFGVDPEFRGHGCFGLLLQAALQWSTARGAAVMWYSTQIVNVSAQKALFRLGFEPAYSLYTFHKWFTWQTGGNENLPKL